MKKIWIVLLHFLLTFSTSKLISQTTFTSMPELMTPNGIFDTIHGRDGNKYLLRDLNLQSSRPFGKGNTINTVPTGSCFAGYFHVFFDPNSVMFSIGSNSAIARTVVCEVFSNLSGFINSPAPLGSINILCDDNASFAYGEPFFIVPFSPANPNIGIIDNLVYKYLTSGTDPYSAIPIIGFPSTNTFLPSNFYHARISVSPNALLTYPINTNTLVPGTVDYYGVVLHEAMHILGFLSNITFNGISAFGSNYNGFSRYDQFLQSYNNTPLLAYSSPSLACGNGNLVFSPLLTPSVVISQSATAAGVGPFPPLPTNCSVAVKYVSSNTTATVYTPVAFQQGSSLSHFEDMCSSEPGFTSSCTPVLTPGFGDLYYVMSDYTSTCAIKRYLKEAEKQVLCDLGYGFNYTMGNLTFTSNAVGATHSYSYGCVPSATVIGNNDGYSNGLYTFTTSNSTYTFIPNDILLNDYPTSGLQVSCLQVVSGNATWAASGSTITVAGVQGSGLTILRYYPQNSSGVSGNVTYVFIYFVPNGCGDPSSCNMVANPGFEINDANTTFSCGTIASNQVIVKCWEPYSGLNLLHVNGCNSIVGQNCNLGVSTLGLSTPVSSFNGQGNTRAVSVMAAANTGALKNFLSSPMLPGGTYRISFWAQNPISSNSVVINPNGLPIVISLASNPVFAFMAFNNFPGGLNPLPSFTIAAGNNWSYVTNTFVYTPTVAAQALIIGADIINAPNTSASLSIYCFLDDINLVPITDPTFVIPQIGLCSNPTLTNLAQYASTVTGATSFSGAAVTLNNSQYDFNLSQTLTPNPSYPIAYNYATNSCSNTIWQNIAIGNSLTIVASNTATYCANTGGSISISASQSTVSGLSYLWQPGNLTGTLQAVSPSVTTVYTVTASNGFCSSSATVLIDVFNNCCGTKTFVSLFAFQNTITGPLFVGADITMPSGNSYLSGEIVLGPNVKITVPGTSTLDISQAHLYACGTEMWKGIVVEDGGTVRMNASIISNTLGIDNLIEGAIKALDVSTYSTSTNTTILDITNTTFNKNFIDINISNYQRSSNTYSNVFTIKNTVFSCRNFTFSPTTWPQVSASDLRSAGNPTSGLASPYLLQGASQATLLAPYAGQTSSIAINFSTVGINGSSVYYGPIIGSSTASNFNLFDNHHTFIYANSSNISSINNVFQNTAYNSTSPGSGSGIYAVTPTNNSNFNNFINLNAPNISTGNRFWNCHRGVEGKNVYRFEIANAIFRSVQSSTNMAFSQGNTGILLNTNRFRYWILNCEFTNINTGINVPLTAGPSTLTQLSSISPAYGLFAGNLTIQDNSFSAGSGAGNYIHQAIDFSSSWANTWAMLANPNISPTIVGTFIQNNTITNAYSGIRVNGIRSFPTLISGNTISLTENPNALAQRGIELSNCTSNATTYGKHIITGNTLKSVGANTLTNSNASLVFCGANMGPGLQSPSVTCNDVQESYNGFEFDNPNLGTEWMGNDMKNLARGLLLNNNGQIGTQGAFNLGMGNSWSGTWTLGTNFGTYCSNSTATSSVLYRAAALTVGDPPNNGGNPSPSSYASGGSIITTTNGASYDCFAPNAKVANDPIVPVLTDGDDVNLFYIAQIALYRFLNDNDSILNSAASYLTFYNDLAGSSIDIFMQVEKALAENDLASAAYLKSTVSSKNSVENNYLSYYDLYLDYAAINFVNDPTISSSDLLTLASLCPGTDGACVYQARALYNSIFNNSQSYPVCSGSSERKGRQNELTASEKYWELSLYPNPASNIVNLKSNNEHETLEIRLSDLSGRVLLMHYVEIKDFFATLDLNLFNGLYLVTFTNQNNEKCNKKLLINL